LDETRRRNHERHRLAGHLLRIITSIVITARSVSTNGNFVGGGILKQVVPLARLRRIELSFVERRRTGRFDLHLPIIVRWGRDAERREALTLSEDVSPNGIFFALAEGIQEGTPIELEMTLPDQITRAGPLRVQCSGRVKRCVQEEGKGPRMAVEIEEFEFLRKSDQAHPQETPPRSPG
jgi:hypothetical protein